MTELTTIRQTCFVLHTRMAARALSRAYDAALRPAGVKSTQFSLLCAIGHGTRLSQTALAQVLGLERTTLIRNLKLLVEKKWVEPFEGDGRELYYRLTESGQATLDKAIPLWESAQRQVEGRLAGLDGGMARSALHSLLKAST